MKKMVTTAVAMMVAATLCFYASAFTPQKIRNLAPDFSDRLYDVSLDGSQIGLYGLSELEAHPSSVLEIVLAGSDSDLFLDQNGDAINSADVTISKMRAANAVAKLYASTGGNHIQKVELNVKNTGAAQSRPVLRVIFADEYLRLASDDFDAELVISIGGEEQSQSRLRIAGTFGCSETVVMADDENVGSENTILVAEEDIKKIVIDAGCDVTVEASLSEGGRYLISAKKSFDESDIEIMDANSSILDVIVLSSAGFNQRQIRGVWIDSDEPLYIYGEDFDFLGMTGKRVDFSEKYYLTEKPVAF